MSKKETKLVVKEEPVNAVATIDVNAMDLLEESAGQGFENVSKKDLATPFIKILQSLSPQVKRTKTEYIEDATEGMFFNTVTKELVNGSDGILVIPCHYQQRYVEWKPNQGGFVKDHGMDVKFYEGLNKNDKGIAITPEGNEVVRYATFYVLVVKKDGSFEPAIISLASTQFKKGLTWNTTMRNITLRKKDGTLFTPAMFSHAYRCKSVPENNDQNDWWGWKIEKECLTPELNNGLEILAAAKNFYELVEQDKVKIQIPDEAPVAGSVDEEVEGAF